MATARATSGIGPPVSSPIERGRSTSRLRRGSRGAAVGTAGAAAAGFAAARRPARTERVWSRLARSWPRQKSAVSGWMTSLKSSRSRLATLSSRATVSESSASYFCWRLLMSSTRAVTSSRSVAVSGRFSMDLICAGSIGPRGAPSAGAGAAAGGTAVCSIFGLLCCPGPPYRLGAKEKRPGGCDGPVRPLFHQNPFGS